MKMIRMFLGRENSLVSILGFDAGLPHLCFNEGVGLFLGGKVCHRSRQEYA